MTEVGIKFSLVWWQVVSLVSLLFVLWSLIKIHNFTYTCLSVATCWKHFGSIWRLVWAWFYQTNTAILLNERIETGFWGKFCRRPCPHLPGPYYTVLWYCMITMYLGVMNLINIHTTLDNYLHKIYRQINHCINSHLLFFRSFSMDSSQHSSDFQLTQLREVTRTDVIIGIAMSHRP